MIIKVRNYWPVIFFIIFLGLGLSIFKDYGISTDERIDNYTGLVNAKYILKTIAPNILQKHQGLAVVQDLHQYSDKHYGPFFQLQASIIPIVAGFSDSREIYFIRHLLNFLYFFFSVLAFYGIIYSRFRNKGFALVGCLMLILTPRIFAESFYNSKDLVFMSLIIITWYTLIQYFRTLTFKWIVLYSVACAACISTRFMGLILFGIGFIWFLQLYRTTEHKALKLRLFRNFIVSTILIISLTILFWPYLWENPIGNFFNIFAKLERGNECSTNLYAGTFIPISKLPWHYIPTWIVITTPLCYLIWFLVGTTYFIFSVKRRKSFFYNSFKQYQDYVAILLFFLPLILIISTKAILYDGWRHLYFIYPALIYVACLGLWSSYSQLQRLESNSGIKKMRRLITIIMSILFAQTAVKMIQMHPYQNVYFSLISSANAQDKFDLDYWGLSYSEGIKYILKNDNRTSIKVAVNFYSGKSTLDILKPEERTRLKFVEEKDADYFLTEYRWHPHPYRFTNEVYKIEANGIKIMSVFKLK